MDTLNFRTTFDWKNTVDSSKKAHLNFYNPVLKSDTGYTILNVFSEFTLNSTDGKPTSVLATDNNQNAKLIRIQRGKGNIFISTTPLLFTNYNILYGNYRYPFVALSYLRGNSIVWDEFYKPNKPEVSSPLRYILTQPALTAAYYLLMIAILFYLLFRGKRKQRVIPVILPHGNLSLEFANTLGQLYFNNGNNKDIALKKYNHFCDYLRNKFFVKNMSDDDEFCRQLSESSGVDFITVSHIFKYARIINSHAWTSDEELIYFNSKIEEFYNKTK